MAAPSRRAHSLLGGPLDKPLIALQEAITGDAVIKVILALLQRAVHCDFVGAFFRVEAHAYGPVGFRFVDTLGRRFEEEVRAGVFFRDHPAMPTLVANPGIRFICTRETLPPNEILHSLPFYRDAMQVIGFRHAIGIYFWDDPPTRPETVFSPARREGRPDFTDEDIAILDRLYPHIDAALRRVRAIDEERAVRDELHGLVDRARAACVLHWDLTVAEESRAARDLCAQWNSGAADLRLKPPPFSLPPVLRNACAELKRRWSDSLPGRPRTGRGERLLVRHPERPSLCATVSVHVQHVDSLGKPAFLIEFKPPRSANETGSSDGKALFASLTIPERELVRLVGEGKSNQEIALETGKALGSVKNALHSIFAKAGVRSRSALIARLGRGRHAPRG